MKNEKRNFFSWEKSKFPHLGFGKSKAPNLTIISNTWSNALVKVDQIKLTVKKFTIDSTNYYYINQLIM